MRRNHPTFIDDLPLTRRALEFASAHHRGQRRDADRAPFILHPLEVAQLLRLSGRPDHVVAAGVLHDVLEQSGATEAELRAGFPDDVAALVIAVSDPGTGDWVDRKARLRERVATAGEDALAIYAADKVARTRELRISLAQARRNGSTAVRLEHYWTSLALLERRLAGDALVRQLRFELETLELLPPLDNGDR